MPRRRFSAARSRSPRRKLVWARVPIGLTIVAGDVGATPVAPVRFDALQIFEQSLGASAIGTTVVRTRGVVSCSPTAAEVMRIRMTAHVGDNADFPVAADDNAFTTTAMNRDYFLFEPFIAFPTETPNTSDVTRRLIDVKSSRKIEELNQTIFVEFSATHNGAAIDQSAVVADLSMLLMLP